MQNTIERKPAIFVLEHELEQLASLVDGDLATQFPAETDALRGELDRAIVLRIDRLSEAFVTMHSTVEYLDVRTGRRNSVTIVWPWEADPVHARVSILAPVGTALIGLRVGDTITWQTPMGREHTWQVLGVRTEPGS